MGVLGPGIYERTGENHVQLIQNIEKIPTRSVDNNVLFGKV